MLDCKAMATSMVSNLKLLQDTTLETVDVTLYRQMVGSLMNLMNTTRYMFCREHPESIYGVA